MDKGEFRSRLATVRDLLLPFQMEGVRKMFRFRGRVLLADDQGLGKTIQTLAWLYLRPDLRPCVIVTPASMKYFWQEEAKKLNLISEVLEGKAKVKKRKKRRPLTTPIIILNYDILKAWLPELNYLSPPVVVFDEVHYIKNTSAKRTRAALTLASQAKCVIGLSGTPLTNRPIELWSVLKAIKPELFPFRDKYAWRYCRPKFTPWGWKYDGAANLMELHRILRSSCMIRRRKKDVLPQLPQKIRETIPYILPPEAQSEYERAKTHFLRWLAEVSPAKAIRAAKSEALVKLGYLLRLTAQLKLPWTLKWIEEFFETHPDEKLVVFSSNTFIIEAVYKRFGKMAVLVSGRVTGKKREKAVKRFQSSPETRLFVGQTRAAGVGLTLTAASHAAFLDLPWTPGELVQGEDRIHRIGQDCQVTIFYLIALDTIEERVVRLLQKKAGILDEVLDGGRKVDEIDIFSALITEFSESTKP